MKKPHWVLLIEVNGAEAEVVRGFLESHKIPVFLNQGGYEGVAFGQGWFKQILVPNYFMEEASKLLHSKGWKLEMDYDDEE